MKHPFSTIIGVSLLLLLPATRLHAGDSLQVDAEFDITGDGIVDASDWRKMSAEQKRAYAYRSVKALGISPDETVEHETQRVDLYLHGLRTVYEKK